MDELTELIEKLIGLGDKIYLRVNPIDFTLLRPECLEVSGEQGALKFQLTGRTVAEQLLTFREVFEEKLAVCWGLEELMGYARFHGVGHELCFRKPVDLGTIENYLGVDLPPPKSFAEAMARVGRIAPGGWAKIYRDIYLPLMLRILPEMEADPVIDVIAKRYAYASYELGQTVSGRLKCRHLSRGYNPHSLATKIAPVGDRVFLTMDYSGMEARVLAWLSGDKVLRDVCESDEDIYGTIWKIISTGDPDPATRQFCKEIFLPVVYGLGAQGLVSAHNLDPRFATGLHAAIYEKFPVALGYVRDAQDEASRKGVVTDHYGRTARFADRPYRARNFVIQAPAALICLERLVALHGSLRSPARLAYHVHDAYTVTCPPGLVRPVLDDARKVLESECPLAPGLKLSLKAKIGQRSDKFEDLDSKYGDPILGQSPNEK